MNDIIETIYSWLSLIHFNAGTVWAITLVFALMFLMALREALAWYLKTYHIRQEIEKLRAELDATQKSLHAMRTELEARLNSVATLASPVTNPTTPRSTPTFATSRRDLNLETSRPHLTLFDSSVKTSKHENSEHQKRSEFTLEIT